MTRRGNFKQWNSRLSAGGANRTNIHGQMSRVSDPEFNLPHHSNSYDLLPAPRKSSFHPWNSRLVAQPRSPQEPPRYWECNSPHHRQSTEKWVPQREMSPDILRDEKGRPVPKRGMFLNAKYSEAVRPIPDEEQIRRTEEVIRRIVDPQRRVQRSSYMPDNGLRDRIRQVVYDMGVPPDYRVPSRHSPHDHHEHNLAVFETQGHSSKQQTIRHNEARAAGNTASFSHRKEVDLEEDCEGNNRDEASSRRSRGQFEKQVCPDPRHHGTSSKNEKRVDKERITEKEKERNHQKKRMRLSDPEKESREQEIPEQHDEPANNSYADASKSNEDQNSSRRSRASTVCTPKPLTPSPQYIRDPDDADNWKNGLSFMSKPCGNGTGMETFARIGSAIPSIPLKDNTQNSYSKVALMLLSRSIKNSKLNEKPNEKKEKLQTQLMNMSTSWVRTMNGEVSDEEKKEPGIALVDEISKIQNPQNATKIQMSESLFKNSRLFDPDISGNRMSTKRQPRMMPPPLFHSSPISNYVFRSDEGMTMPSSIRKTVQSSQAQIDYEEEEPTSRAQDVDDYIARGSSQIHFTREIESLSSSFKQTSPNESASVPRQEILVVENQPQSSNLSGRSSDSAKETSLKANNREEKTNMSAVSSKSKNDGYTLQLNSQFLFSAKKKKTGSQPVLDFDEATQKMFDAVFDNDSSTLQKRSEEKDLF